MRRGPPARSTKAKARIDRYHRMLDEAPPPDDAEPAFRIPPGPRLGTRVVSLRGVTLRVDDRTLVRGLDLELGRTSRLGIVGPNGAGKTTLLRTICGERPCDAGVVEVGGTVRIASIDQKRSELDPDQTVSEAVAGDGDHVRLGDRAVRIEPFLDGFLFPGGRKQARIGQLSGGERNRVLLAKLLVQGGNLLVLYEPTNDLDLPTLRALEEALTAFDGAVVVVSHDRWFLDRVATEIVHLDGEGRCLRFGGDVSTLLERVSEERAAKERAAAQQLARERDRSPAPSAAAPSAAPRARRLSTWETRELDELPGRIEESEQRLAELTARLAEPSLYAGPVAERERVSGEHATLVATTERLLARWEELASREG
jgi:ATP-binding cassette subfamily F protein uup